MDDQNIAIPKIEWAIELLYNSVQDRSQTDQLELEDEYGRESHARLKGPLGDPWWVGGP